MSDADGLQPTTKIELIETELRSLWETRGRLIEADILEVAAAESHPLHPFFEWDDTEAARRYRLAQAATMIRSVKVRVTTLHNGDVEDFKIRAWVSARAAGQGVGGYLPEDQVRGNPDQRERVLRQMLRELNAFRRRYSHMAEYWAAVEAPLTAAQQAVEQLAGESEAS
jgi:hypothetical protein